MPGSGGGCEAACGERQPENRGIADEKVRRALHLHSEWSWSESSSEGKEGSGDRNKAAGKAEDASKLLPKRVRYLRRGAKRDTLQGAETKAVSKPVGILNTSESRFVDIDSDMGSTDRANGREVPKSTPGKKQLKREVGAADFGSLSEPRKLRESRIKGGPKEWWIV